MYHFHVIIPSHVRRSANSVVNYLENTDILHKSRMTKWHLGDPTEAPTWKEAMRLSDINMKCHVMNQEVYSTTNGYLTQGYMTTIEILSEMAQMENQSLPSMPLDSTKRERKLPLSMTQLTSIK